MDLTAGDGADPWHILHEDFHFHVCSKKMVQLTIIEVKIQEIWNSTKGHIFKLSITIMVGCRAEEKESIMIYHQEKTTMGAE